MNNQKLKFSSFLVSYVSLSVIAGLFTYRLLNSFLDNIIFPLVDMTLLPDEKFHKLTKAYNHQKKEIDPDLKKENYVYVVRPGIFLKELTIWCFIMLLLYSLYSISYKPENSK